MKMECMKSIDEERKEAGVYESREYLKHGPILRRGYQMKRRYNSWKEWKKL